MSLLLNAAILTPAHYSKLLPGWEYEVRIACGEVVWSGQDLEECQETFEYFGGDDNNCTIYLAAQLYPIDPTPLEDAGTQPLFDPPVQTC